MDHVPPLPLAGAASRLCKPAALVVYLAANVSLMLGMPWWVETDHLLWAAIPSLLENRTLYDHGLPGVAPYVWSPVMAPVMGFAGWIGPALWAALHVAGLALLRDWRLVALILVSWAFWRDAVAGGTVSFAVVLGVLALRGSRWSAVGYLVLVMLVPRPMYFPLAAWLLWTDRRLWVPFLVAAVAHLLAVVGSGYAFEWLAATTRQGAEPTMNMGPTAAVGMAWLVVALPLAAFLLWVRLPGLAGFVVAPYILPNYFLFPMIDVWRPSAGRGWLRKPNEASS